MTLELKTYSHLMRGARRLPSEYDICTADVLWYPRQGFEVQTPLAAWFARHQLAGGLHCADWDAFKDPREMTYSAYVNARRAGEDFIDGVLRSMEATGYDRRLTPDWLDTLEQVLPVLRFPLHGLHMAAAYGGHLAPSGRLVALGAFQAADEMRRVQRLAYRMRQLQNLRPGFGDASRAAWLTDEAWQPLRSVTERMLTIFDWGEAFAAVNLGVKPVVDDFLYQTLPKAAARNGDPLLGELLFSLREDAEWHAEWSAALVKYLGAEEVMERWAAAWRRDAMEAVERLGSCGSLQSR